ncbi:MAG: endolytic transglycosylase MltG [Luteimonas sp.]
MSKNPQKRRFGAFFVVSALLAGVFAYWAYQRYTGFADAPLHGIVAGESVVVEPGDSFAAVLAKLRKAGIDEGHRIEWQALAKQLGAAGRIQVGEYALDPGTTPRQLLLRMRDGRVVSYRFTIVEGWNIRELRAALARAKPLKQDGAELDDAALMKSLGNDGQHPEGRFLPETYAYTSVDSDLTVLERAHSAMDKALDSAWNGRGAETVLKSKDEALTLASIVEKETGVASERAQIAGVFARRLKLGMRLQTDPTVIYGMGSRYAGNIRRSDLLADTPYNTYTRDGLPPTPIAMPGADALRAATHPAAGDTLYFVALGDGSGRHAFTRTLAEHESAVNAYLQRYRAQRTPK